MSPSNANKERRKIAWNTFLAYDLGTTGTGIDAKLKTQSNDKQTQSLPV